MSTSFWSGPKADELIEAIKKLPNATEKAAEDANEAAEKANRVNIAMTKSGGVITVTVTDRDNEETSFTITDPAGMIADDFDPAKVGGYKAGECCAYNGSTYMFTANHTGAWTGTDVVSGPIVELLVKYDDLQRVIKITDTSTTLGAVATVLDGVNGIGDHVFFDVSALGASMYLCTIYIDTSEGVYKIFDLVKGRIAEGTYDASMLLTMAIAMASDAATQSQIDFLQGEIDELGGKSVLANWDALADKILDGTSTDLIDAGDTVDINWIDTVLGTTTTGLTVACSDADAFITEMGEAEAKDYLFVFDGEDWTYNGDAVDLEDYAITVSGTPATGEVMTIKTTIIAKNFTFAGYDDIEPADSGVTHNWCLEQTYAPDTKAYDTYESLFCVQAGKSVPAGKYYLPLYSYRSSKTFNACFELAGAIGGDSKIQMSRVASGTATRPDNTGADKTDVYAVTSAKPIVYGSGASAGSNVAVTYLSDADAAAGSYSLLTDLNTDPDDSVVVVGDMDKAALGSNCWHYANLRQHLNDDTKGDSFVPAHDNDVASAYNRLSGFLWGMDPRVRKYVQTAVNRWTAGYGNTTKEGAYAIATGTVPSSNPPTYYEKTGTPGNWTYTALDPQPTSGDSVAGYYVYTDSYQQGKIYESEDEAFLLSMKEMSFNIQTDEGSATDLYSAYTSNTLVNTDVAARAKYNKAGGTKNSYRWSRSGLSAYASISWLVTSGGGNNSSSAYSGYYYAPAFIVGKSA